MTEATCAVLTAIFPIVLLTVVLERRTIHVKIRRRRWFRQTTVATIVAAAGGLGYTVIGVQIHGFSWPAAWVAWLCFAMALGGLLFSLLAAAATTELEEDSPGHED